MDVSVKLSGICSAKFPMKEGFFFSCVHFFPSWKKQWINKVTFMFQAKAVLSIGLQVYIFQWAISLLCELISFGFLNGLRISL